MPASGLGCKAKGITKVKFRCCIIVVRYKLTFCGAAAVVAVVAGVAVGEDVVGLVQPAARTAASISTANAPAKNDFFIVNPRKVLITCW
jgi:hypothetical protein